MARSQARKNRENVRKKLKAVVRGVVAECSGANAQRALEQPRTWINGTFNGLVGRDIVPFKLGYARSPAMLLHRDLQRAVRTSNGKKIRVNSDRTPESTIISRTNTRRKTRDLLADAQREHTRQMSIKGDEYRALVGDELAQLLRAT